MMIEKKLLILAAAAISVSGCGDSLDEGQAAGVYEGITSTGVPFYALVAKNDELWTIYTSQTSGVGLTGLIQGLGAAEGGKFTARDLKDFGFSPPQSWSFDGTYQTGASFSGTLRRDDISTSLSASIIPATTFDFNVPANVAFIAGQWSLSSTASAAASLTITLDGTITGNEGSCQFSGKISPRTDGTNVYTHTITFGAAPCRLPNQNVSGIAVSLTGGTTTRQLIIAGTNAARTVGAVYFGSKL